MTLPDVHLATEAVAAYVDDALSHTARDRAKKHLRSCSECRGVVDAQREAKVLLAAAPDPAVPIALLARLREIPMTADLGPGPFGPLGPLGGDDVMVTVEDGELAWTRRHLPAQNEPRLLERNRSRSGAVAVADRPPPAQQRIVLSPAPGPARPASYPSLAAARFRRGRRTLAGALAGLAFGVVVSTVPTGSPGTALPQRQAPAGPAGSVTQLGGSGSAPNVTTLDVSRLTGSGYSPQLSFVGGGPASRANRR